MANIYVRSTDGNNADNGSTWALAKATLAGADAIDAAGDVVYVSQSHAESTAAAVTLSFGGSRTTQIRVVCANDAAEPPTASATTATVTTTGNSNLTIGGALTQYFYGISFVAGSGASGTSRLSLTGRRGLFENCAFYAASTSGGDIRLTTDSLLVLKGCDFRFNQSSGPTIYLLGAGEYRIEGGQINAGTVGPATFITLNAATARCIVDGVDLSSGPSTMNLLGGTGSTSMYVAFRNCKLPPSWSGALFSGTFNDSEVFELFNCDSGDTNYAYQRAMTWGSILSETTIVRSGGASDGTTPFSWKFVTNSRAAYPSFVLSSAEIVRWNETTGSSITVTVETVTDNVTLTDSECWLEIEYLGASGYPLGRFISDAKAGPAEASANQATSTETWTTTGLTTPVKQKLSVSFTPQEKGFIHAVVKLAKASTTVYVDPVLTVT